jgi:hypothetical protein
MNEIININPNIANPPASLIIPSEMVLPMWNLRPLLLAGWGTLTVTHWVSNYVILHSLFSGLLFEEIFVNRILLPIYLDYILLAYPIKFNSRAPISNFSNKFGNKENRDKIISQNRISFWFNDWLYNWDVQDSKFLETIQLEEELPEEEMYIPAYPAKRHKYKHVRAQYTRSEWNIENRIRTIILRSLIYSIICTFITFSVEVYENLVPLKIFTVLFVSGLPAFLWKEYLCDVVNVKYLLEDFRTPRNDILTLLFVYGFPIGMLFAPEFEYLYFGIFQPFFQNNLDNRTYQFSTSILKRASRFVIGVYNVWNRIGLLYASILVFSGLVDNFWDSIVLPRFEKTQLTTCILDVYRIRTTDKIIALYAFIIPGALEIFGKPWYDVWDPFFADIYFHIAYAKYSNVFPGSNILDFTSNDDLLVYHHTIGSNISFSIANWFEHIYNYDPISQMGCALSCLYHCWAGIPGFLFSMLYRGLRFRGPDTYPMPGTAPPRLPSRLPFVIINWSRQPFKAKIWLDNEREVDQFENLISVKKSKKERYRRTKGDVEREQSKMFQVLPRAKWQKYFVRWNWCYGFTITYFHSFIIYGILKLLIGSTDTYFIKLNSEGDVQQFFTNLIYFQGILWFYGVICCLFGHCAGLPIVYKACRFNVGRFWPITEKFNKQEKTLLPLYPYDTIEYRRMLNARFPHRKLSRIKKIRIFIHVQFKKLKENIPKLLFILIILLFFIGLVHDAIRETLLYFITDPEPMIKSYMETEDFLLNPFAGSSEYSHL